MADGDWRSLQHATFYVFLLGLSSPQIIDGARALTNGAFVTFPILEKFYVTILDHWKRLLTRQPRLVIPNGGCILSVWSYTKEGAFVRFGGARQGVDPIERQVDCSVSSVTVTFVR